MGFHKCEWCDDDAMSGNSRFCYDCVDKYLQAYKEGQETMERIMKENETPTCENCGKASKNINPCKCGFHNLGFVNEGCDEQ